jgi:hypothetical protein
MRLVVLLVSALALASTSLSASATHNADRHSANMSFLFSSPNGRDQVNSDQAFWGKYAYQGDYGGFRIFDISNPASPSLVGNMVCLGAQNDITVWDRDGNGQADIAFTSVDRTQTGPNCGSTNAAHDDPAGWEGLRIFDISNPAAPTQIGSVYLDCGSHTNTLWPDLANNRVLLYNSSYPLRPGPTCGPIRGPAAGRDPLHGVIQVVEVKWSRANPLNNNLVTAKEIAEPKINYPGDADNKFVPAEHGLGPATDPTLVQGMRACHDISVFVPLRLAAAACAEQAQVWRVRPNGMPVTEKPLWVYDDTVDETGTTGNVNDKGIVVDFWHSSTFSWDGEIVHFEDESFSSGSCPPETPAPGETATQPGDTGRMFFFSRAGKLLSSYMAPKPWETEYCSAHLGNVVPATDKYLLVFGWYMGGMDVIDFTNPANPTEVAYYDAAGGTPPSPAGVNGFDNWTAYWYEGPSLPEKSLTIYGTDGVHDPVDDDGGARGFVVMKADVAAKEVKVSRLNPQTQEFVLGPGGVIKCKGKVATLVGTKGSDRLVGTRGKDVVAALGGNDRVNGRGGKDLVCGAKGKDRLRGSGGNDRLYGQGDNDRLNGGAGVDLCSGGPGRDRGRKCEVTRSIP